MFTRATVAFLDGLERHNDKAWFDAHRGDYDEQVVAPARAFVPALGERLRKLSKTIRFEPKIGGSIMRIHRDIRFSKDKSPYKTTLDLWFWSGDDKGWDRPGFFFRLTPTELMLGAGMHHFERDALARYRAAVADDKRGAALARAVAKVRAAGYQVGGESYKKVPRGFAPDHPRAALLKHDGLHGGLTTRHPKELFGEKLPDYCHRHFAAMGPLFEWLLAM